MTSDTYMININDSIELISPILGKKHKQESFLSKKNDDFSLMQNLKLNDDSIIENDLEIKEQNVLTRVQTINHKSTNSNLLNPKFTTSGRASFKENLNDLKKELLKSRENKKTTFFLKGGIKKLLQLKEENIVKERTLKKNAFSEDFFQLQHQFNKELYLPNNPVINTDRNDVNRLDSLKTKMLTKEKPQIVSNKNILNHNNLMPKTKYAGKILEDLYKKNVKETKPKNATDKPVKQVKETNTNKENIDKNKLSVKKYTLKATLKERINTLLQFKKL
jgi:hypothetical protein